MSDLQIKEDLVASVPQFKTGVGGEREETSDGSNRRSFGSSNLPSPETEEFESLEKSFREELEQKLHERKISEAERKTSDLATGRRLSGLSSKTRKETKCCKIFEQNNNKAMISLTLPLTCCTSSEEDPLSLQLVEKRQLRSFSRADEYLYAMKEDLAEWLNMLYPTINIHAENFMDCLQTGEHLLRVSTSIDCLSTRSPVVYVPP